MNLLHGQLYSVFSCTLLRLRTIILLNLSLLGNFYLFVVVGFFGGVFFKFSSLLKQVIIIHRLSSNDLIAVAR